MRIRVYHDTTYRYAQPASAVIQTVRLTPRNHDGQYLMSWRIDVSNDCRMQAREDAFGNLTHAFYVEGPFSEFTVSVIGEVETQDTAGIVRGGAERFPPALFLRETDLTHAHAPIRAFADSVRGEGPADALSLLHRLMERIHTGMTYDTDPTHAATTAAESFDLGRGVCQDLTHVFLASARHLGIPARYIGGYFHRADGVVDQTAGHAWAEAFLPDLGWIGFDPANNVCMSPAHIRVAVGLDYLGAAPVRGTRYGGGAELLDVTVVVAQAQNQMQG
jgi:transglutaminase-like putative cysteine protease